MMKKTFSLLAPLTLVLFLGMTPVWAFDRDVEGDPDIPQASEVRSAEPGRLDGHESAPVPEWTEAGSQPGDAVLGGAGGPMDASPGATSWLRLLVLLPWLIR